MAVESLYWCVALGVFVWLVGVVEGGGGGVFRVLARPSLQCRAWILPVGHEQ